MVKHILKDGRTVDSVAGMVVKYEEAEAVYKLLNDIARCKNEEVQN